MYFLHIQTEETEEHSENIASEIVLTVTLTILENSTSFVRISFSLIFNTLEIHTSSVMLKFSDI